MFSESHQLEAKLASRGRCVQPPLVSFNAGDVTLGGSDGEAQSWAMFLGADFKEVGMGFLAWIFVGLIAGWLAGDDRRK